MGGKVKMKGIYIYIHMTDSKSLYSRNTTLKSNYPLIKRNWWYRKRWQRFPESHIMQVPAFRVLQFLLKFKAEIYLGTR